MNEFEKWVLATLTIIIVVMGLGLVFGLPVMWLWNWLMPIVFGLPKITFWQALGLYFLCHALFPSAYVSRSK